MKFTGGSMKHNNPKKIYREKMHIAVENFLTAEQEGAKELTPDTYAWAKSKLYYNKKMILLFPDDIYKIQEATDDAAAASATLLATVREMTFKKLNSKTSERDPIENLMNEGGPSI